ncbi:hypothetical protein THAOC_15491, partial [Thalassiosira oceanica]
FELCVVPEQMRNEELEQCATNKSRTLTDAISTVHVTPARTTGGRIVFLAIVYDGANVDGLRIDPASRRFVPLRETGQLPGLEVCRVMFVRCHLFDYFYIELRGDGCSIGQATKFAVCILRMSWRCPFFVFDLRPSTSTRAQLQGQGRSGKLSLF